MGTKFYKAKNLIGSRGVSLRETGKIFFILILLVSGHFFSFSQTTPLSFTQISLGSTDLIAHGRGAEYWNGVSWTNGSGGGVLVPSGNTKSSNAYYRFDWGIEIETAQGVYNWAKFDQQINSAIDNGQMFSFGLMPMCTACSNTGIAGLTYPRYLHTLMQAEAAGSQDWFYSAGNVWVPNWNSPNYLGRYQALLNAVAAHIASGSHNGKNYKDVIYYVDIRGYGDFGEWHTYPWYGTEPAGRKATSATLKALIDMNLAAFPNYPNVIMISAFNQGGASQIPTDVSYYALTKSNAWGPLGWRRDNWGDPNTDNILANNGSSYNPGTGSVAFAPLITNRYKTSPIVGEPNNATGSTGAPYTDLSREINLYHATSFGDGNFPNAGDPTTQANIIACSKVSGYRLVLTGGNMTTTLTSGGGFSMSLNWQNIGVAPTYENWDVVYELRKSDGTVVWKGNSTFKPKLFIPQGTPTTASDNFTLSAVAAGTYSMYLIVRDPLNYKTPLPLAITGRNADGSYLLRSNVTVTTGGPVNQPPTANAGADITIQLPISTVSLTGVGTDPDGTISTYAWTKLSGPAGGTITTPAVANTSITGLVQGTYVFTLTVTDNQGATATDNIQVTVNAAAVNLPPTANAGADNTVQLPATTVSLTGAGTDADGTISTYAWTKLSGPAGGTITTPGTANTSITGLIQGVYVFTLTVTDNLGATGTDNVQVTVNAAAVNQPPTANAGADNTIQLPTTTVSLTGAGTDADGTIATYAWTKLSGPAGGTITTPGTANTSITGLIQGVFVFTLTVTDNLGATAIDNIQVTVNAAAVNQPPVSNAGADLNISLPTNSITLNGSASSDPDGSITTYLWTKISGPAQFTIGNNTTASTIVNNLTAGLYSFQLKVTDNGGAIALDTVKVNVNAAPLNQPPVANAGADIAITLPTNIANLSGTASTDPDGTISSYAWSQVSGPVTATIANPASATTGLSGLQQGVYIFLLTVTDNSGSTDLDSIKVTVNPAANLPPVANAGSSKSITLPLNNTGLDGSLSLDPDGSIATYAWNQLSGPSTATITGGNLSLAIASNLVAGVYTFDLTVTDNSGASANANVKITVVASGIQPPVANAGADQTITLPTNSVTIDGSGSSASSGSIVSYLWTEKSGPSIVSLSNSAQNTLNNLQAGVYVFSLKVTDNNAATGTDSVVITVNPAANIAPVANAGASISLSLPANSTSLNGSASYDVDGTISTFIWTLISGPSNPTVSGANTATLSVSSLIAGQYTYQLTVTDNSGASSSAQVNIIVIAAGNIAPIANAGANQGITAPANSVNLNGSASADPDGTITAYSWVTVSGPGSITINNSNTVTPSVIGLQTGVYIFELTVTDNSGASAKDQVTVIVSPNPILPNQAPVANAGNNMTITEPVNSLNLNGSSSFDPDGTLTGFSWTQISGPAASVIAAGNTSSATATQLIVGQYVFQLTVTDNNGATNTDQITVTVNPGVSKVNLPPVAYAGSSDTISLPNNAYSLNASQSIDPDGTIESYQWLQIGGPSTVNSSSMNSATVSISNLEAGIYEFQVTVTDDAGASSAATMKLTVEQSLSSLSTTTDRLNVFPNPANGVIHEKITSSITGTVKINVYDMNGKLVMTAQTEKTSDILYNKLNVSGLAPGMYTIQINLANRKTMVAKFIKN